MYQPKTKQWFIDRIGKRIYRDASTCACNTCKEVEENGLVIFDEQHAGYLADVDGEFGSDGYYMNYRDNK